MKRFIWIFLLGAGTLFAATYTTQEAAMHLGEEATVCGTVNGGYYAKKSRGKPTFINLDGRYPNQAFTVVIWGDHRHKFTKPEKTL